MISAALIVVVLLLTLGLAGLWSLRPEPDGLSAFELARRAALGELRAVRQQRHRALVSELRGLWLVCAAVCVALLAALVFAATVWWLAVPVLAATLMVVPPLSRQAWLRAGAERLYARQRPRIEAAAERWHRPLGWLVPPAASQPETPIAFSREELLAKLSTAHELLSTHERQQLAAGLAFAGATAADVMTARGSIVALEAGDTLGPVELDRLHNSGHSCFPVYSGDLDRVQGLLHLEELQPLPKSLRHARDAAHPPLGFIRADHPLERALAVLLQSHLRLLIVIDETGSTLGVLSLSDVARALLGRRPGSGSLNYADAKKVAVSSPRPHQLPRTGEMRKMRAVDRRLNMARILAREVIAHVGKTVELQGWLHKKRLLGGLTFINLRDRSGLTQVVLQDKDEVEKLRGLQIGTVLKVSGVVMEEPRAPGGAELHEATLEVLVPVTAEPPIEIDKPIPHKAENLDTLFEYRALNVRNLQEQKIFKIRASLLRYLREFLTAREFIEIQTPKLLAEATEGGAEVFTLDYFSKQATLAQSPQLYKQMMVGAFERVFEIAPAFRAELSATTRHMTEVTMLDIELGFVADHGEVLDMVGAMTSDAVRRAYQEHADDLKSLNAPELKLADTVPRFTVADIHAMYTKATKTDTTAEKDLTPDEERWICEYSRKQLGSDLVFATHFPVEAIKFYHQVNPDDPSTVLWGDLLFRGLEIATCPLREHRHDRLVAQMQQAGMDIAHPGYKYYLQAFEYGLPQHGGCGFGVDRLVEKTIGLANVKEATLFPRDINRLAP